MNDLFLLHGALGSASMFHPLQDRINKGKVFMPDLPGHGNNADQGTFSIEYFTQFLIDHIEKNTTQPVDLFGYSLGGYLALCIAFKRPDLVNKVMTVATKFNWNPEIASKECAQLDPDKLELKAPAFIHNLSQQHHHTPWRTLIDRTTTLLNQLGEKPLITREVLQQLVMEICIGLGDHDQMVSLEETIETYRQIPNGKLCVLPGSRHAFHQINESMLLHAIQQFFS